MFWAVPTSALVFTKDDARDDLKRVQSTRNRAKVRQASWTVVVMLAFLFCACLCKPPLFLFDICRFSLYICSLRRAGGRSSSVRSG